jgi:hypothetical protein
VELSGERSRVILVRAAVGLPVTRLMDSRRFFGIVFLVALFVAPAHARAQQRYTGADGRLRVALAKQPFSPAGVSVGPTTMANDGIQALLGGMGATVRVEESSLSASEEPEYGA